MKEYVVKNNKTGRSRIIRSTFEISLDVVWMSEKCWYSDGCSITITDEKGNSKTFTK